MPILRFVDEHLQCVSCGCAFVFGAGEQELLHLLGITRKAICCSRCVRCGGRSADHRPDGPSRWGWNRTKLLHQRERIEVRPAVYQFPIRNLDAIGDRKLDRFVGRGHTCECTLVRAG